MSARSTAPSLLTCFALLAVMDTVPRAVGLRRVLQWALRQRQSGPVVRAPQLVEETARRIALAAAFYPRRARCLEQSLALYVLLLRRGIEAQLKLGVQPRPFYAHAWVELDGRPVNEREDILQRLTPFNLAEV